MKVCGAKRIVPYILMHLASCTIIMVYIHSHYKVRRRGGCGSQMDSKVSWMCQNKEGIPVGQEKIFCDPSNTFKQ